MKKLLFGGMALMLAGCTHDFVADGEIPAVDVIRQIKSDVGAYNAFAKAAANEPEQNNACRGKVDFVITSVALSLQTSTSETGGGSIGAKIPVGAGGSLGPSLEASKNTSHTQTVNFTLYPMATADGEGRSAPSALFGGQHPFTDALKQ